MSTIHSAKGLEFNHVIIPGGGWQRSNGKQNQEEERRLCYVAMTRARETLAMMERADESNPHTGLLDGDFSMRRQPTIADDLPREITSLRYDLLALEDVYLDFAGRQADNHPVHKCLGALLPGSLLSVSFTPKEHIELLDSAGVSIARFSSKAREIWMNRIDRIQRVSVVAMIERRIDDVDVEYAAKYLCKKWEVPVVEIIWK